MDIQSIFANGLPQELKNLQEGQMYIFPKLDEGLIETNVLISQYISAASGKLLKENNVKNKRPVVFVIPTSNTALWDCIVCRKTTIKGDYIEIADKGSLLEMIYDYYGLEYSQDGHLKMSDRYKISISDSHPIRIPLYKSNKMSNSDVEKDEDTTYDWLTPSLSCLTDKRLSPSDVRKTILTALYDAEYNKDRFGVDYNIEELLKDFNAEKDKTYTLEIVPEEVIGKKGGHKIPFIDCHIYITDNNGKKEELILPSQEKAVYLMFMLHKDGLIINDFPKDKNDEKNKKKYNLRLRLYTLIQSKLLDNNYIENPQLYQGDIRPIINKIKNKLSDITTNKKYLEMFAIEGYSGKPFKISAATQEQIDSIIEAFKIDTQEFGL